MAHLRRLIDTFQRLPISQQLALVAAGCCLIATLALVALAARSSQYTQDNLQNAYGHAVAEQLARRLSSELAAGDLLGVTAELQKLVEQGSIAGARAIDIEGNSLAEAGNIKRLPLPFTAPILIAGDMAGRAEVATDTREQDEARLLFLIGLSALAVLLSIVVYGITRPLGQRLARNIDAISAELADVTGAASDATNELDKLRERVAALPLNLLRPGTAGGQRDEHYDDTAVLYLHFNSLPGYIDTLDEQRLQRYIQQVHRLIFGAAGFYGGRLQVVRQLGLAIFFSGEHKVGSPILRAASCGWLIQQACPDVEEYLHLSIKLGMAIGLSELGLGDSDDIYPGLYTQAPLDELQGLASDHEDGIAVTAAAATDIDLTTRVEIETAPQGHLMMGGLADGHRDLLERQLHILLKAVVKTAPNT